MNWENKATDRSLRLGAYSDDKTFYYEICQHAAYNNLFIECEKILPSRILRVYQKETTVKDLLIEFPELKDFTPILYAYQTIGNLHREKEFYKDKYYQETILRKL